MASAIGLRQELPRQTKSTPSFSGDTIHWKVSHRKRREGRSQGQAVEGLAEGVQTIWRKCSWTEGSAGWSGWEVGARRVLSCTRTGVVAAFPAASAELSVQSLVVPPVKTIY